MSLNVMVQGQGRSLLLLHGFSGSARSWSGQVTAWSTSHRVIAPDLLGHGGSDAPADAAAYALERQAADLARLLELLEAAPATAVGYSMGARLALVLALDFPHAITALVLESPSAGIADARARTERRAADDRLAADLEREGIGSFVDRWQALPLFASHASLSVEVQERQRTERMRHDPRGLAGSLRGAGQGSMTPLHGRLGEISVPTLVIAGELDSLGAERAKDVAAGIPGARLAIIDGVGHTPHLEDPSAFEAGVGDFLSATGVEPLH